MFILGSFDAKKKVVDRPAARRIASKGQQGEREEEPPGEGHEDDESHGKASCSSAYRKRALPLPPMRSDTAEAPNEGSPILFFSSSMVARKQARSAAAADDESPSSSSTSSGQTQRTSSCYSTFESTSHCPSAATQQKHPHQELIHSSKLPRNGGHWEAVHAHGGGGSTGSCSTTEPCCASVMDRIRRFLRSNSDYASKESRCNEALSWFSLVAPFKRGSMCRSVWKFVALVAAVVATTVWVSRHASSGFAPGLDEKDRLNWIPHERGSQLVWGWDHNVYHPATGRREAMSDNVAEATHGNDPTGRESSRHSHTEAHENQERRRNLLVVQMGAYESSFASDYRDPPLSSSSYSSAPWLDISSRPNRAYAKQWGMDYAMISTPPLAVESARRQWRWPWHHASQRHEDGSTLWSLPHNRLRHQFGLDVISVLQYLLDRQEAQEQEESSADMAQADAPDPSEDESVVAYDAVILVPNNAVIIDMDYDLLRLLPEDKIAALSWNQQGAGQDDDDESDGGYERCQITFLDETVLVFNLQHPYSRSVVNKWLDLALGMNHSYFAREPSSAPRHVSSDSSLGGGCGHSGDLRLLLQAIETVALEDSKGDVSSLVLNLTQSRDGFVGRDDDSNPRVIKTIALYPMLSGASALQSNVTDLSMSGVPSSPAIMNAAFALQTAADSVCYRYYPKCEVL